MLSYPNEIRSFTTEFFIHVVGVLGLPTLYGKENLMSARFSGR